MKRRLSHSDIQQVVERLGESQIVNLDTSLKATIQPLQDVLGRTPDEVSLHILCCDEYFLVTGLTADRVLVRDIAGQAGQIRDDLG